NERMMVSALECIEEHQVFSCDSCNVVCQVSHFRTAATGRCYSVEGDPAAIRCFCFYQC
ncbi:hypothetical protein Tco_0337923, partial [Tanacetum coccineum]